MEMVIIVIIDFLIGFISSLVGAMAGLGGGVIIKPVLDFAGHYDLATIGVLSAATVFAMSSVSLVKSGQLDVNIDVKVSSLIAVGSIAGGIIGKWVFNYFVVSLDLNNTIGVVQSTVLALILLLILIYFRWNHFFKSYVIRNPLAILAAGLALGFLSAFLGIGGGPLNVAILALLFSMNGKEAVINSTFIIFFSQLAALLLVAFTSGYTELELSMLGYMIAGGVIGGFIGSSLLYRISEKVVTIVFTVTVFIVMVINVYNVFQYL
ncbi:sulfite exporter TauE/SafE family protein [Thalassobacillus devorans]|uniref:sulfite exporter TauE/SafE family protein n=1 Tax=Thalassobacillus devorans TaxID=279813 RepID=UPI0020CACC03|nr:sulfite exporter TauE/SafE family protein [Thalassobacillus devorans]